MNLYRQGEVSKLWITRVFVIVLSDGKVSWIQDPTAPLLTLFLVWFPPFASINYPSCIVVSEAFLFPNYISIPSSGS